MAQPASNIARGVKVSGEGARRWARIRIVTAGVAVFTGLLVAAPVVPPAGASPGPAAGSGRAGHAGSHKPKGAGGDFGDTIQKALLGFAAQKLAGFAFNQLGLDKLLGGSEADLNAVQEQLNTIIAQQKVIQESLDGIKGDLSKILLGQYEVELARVTSGIDSLYNHYYLPALGAATAYVRESIKTGGKCDTDACLTAKQDYLGVPGDPDRPGLRKTFLSQFDTGTGSWGIELHKLIIPGPSGSSIMSAYGQFLVTNDSNGFLAAGDSDKILNYYNYWADYRALAEWMIGQWASTQPGTVFDNVLSEIESQNTSEQKAFPPRIPPDTAIVLPKNAALRTDNTAHLPMWGAPAEYSPVEWWDPIDNSGVPDAISAMNHTTGSGYGFHDWRVPSRTELDALLSRGPASQTGSQFLLSLNPGWDKVLTQPLADAPYIWTTQEAGSPPWAGSPEVVCQRRTATWVNVATFNDYAHTAVGSLDRNLSGFPAQVRNDNRPEMTLPNVTNGISIIQASGAKTDQEAIDYCKTVLHDAYVKVENAPTSLSTLLATRNTGDVNYLP